MNTSRLFLASIFFILFSGSGQASPVDTYLFQDEVTKVRFQALNKELRCPKCQNQNLADSNSPIAADLRKEVYELLQQGKADSEIVTFMVDRYGEFVLYRPRVSQLTYVLWFGPIILILVGIFIVIMIVRRQPVAKKDLDLTVAQQKKINALFRQQVSFFHPVVRSRREYYGIFSYWSHFYNFVVVYNMAPFFLSKKISC
jgi:cytochrome c-type biogenesis protein CcmH